MASTGRCLLAAFIALGVFACTRQTSVPSVTLPAPSQAAGAPLEIVDPALPKQLVERVAEAERAYEEHAEPRAILSLIAEDARIEAARSERSAPRDWRFTHERLEAIYTWAAKYATETTFSYKDVHVVTNTPLHVVFTWTTMSESHGGSESWFGQRYELERRGGDWKVIAFRYWPLRPDTGNEFGTAYFADLDRQVSAALKAGDQKNAAYNMMLGYRFDECARLAREIADANPDDWWSWDMRSRASAMVGDLEDAVRAGDKAATLKK